MSETGVSPQDVSSEDESAREAGGPPQPQRKTVRLAFLPLIVFAGVAGLFLVRLFSGDVAHLPSALIGQEVPPFDLPPLQGLADKLGLSSQDLRQGHVTVLNVFASWCAPCHEENPFLLALARDASLAGQGVQLVGMAYKDAPEDTRRYLAQDGDPYARIGVDQSGRTGIDFGVYGVPETYVIKGDGTIAFKFVGPIDQSALRATLLPQIEKALH